MIDVWQVEGLTPKLQVSSQLVMHNYIFSMNYETNGVCFCAKQQLCWCFPPFGLVGRKQFQI